MLLAEEAKQLLLQSLQLGAVKQELSELSVWVARALSSWPCFPPYASWSQRFYYGDDSISSEPKEHKGDYCMRHERYMGLIPQRDHLKGFQFQPSWCFKNNPGILKVWKQSCAQDNSIEHKVLNLSQKTARGQGIFSPQRTDLDLPKIVYGWGFWSVWCRRIIRIITLKRERERENF